MDESYDYIGTLFLNTKGCLSGCLKLDFISQKPSLVPRPFQLFNIAREKLGIGLGMRLPEILVPHQPNAYWPGSEPFVSNLCLTLLVAHVIFSNDSYCKP